MTQPRHEVTFKRVRYELPGTDRVVIRRGVEYRTGGGGVSTMDLYYPPDGSRCSFAPGVVFISGFSDLGAVPFLGCRINEMESYISWARLVAASGLVAITYTTGADPAQDAGDVIDHLAAHGAALGIDAERLGLWAGSSHVPNALGVMMGRPSRLRCSVLCYGFMLDLDGATGTAEAQRIWRFANPAAGKTVADLPPDVPLFIVRAGQDSNPGLNDAIDRFVSHALKRNVPITLVNHHSGPHAFDLEEDSVTSRAIVQEILAFLQSRLLGQTEVRRPLA
jgi:hypothetical protein